MSLNRNEQRVFDYLQLEAEERHYWQHKVQSFASTAADDFSAAARLETALWSYYIERAGVVPSFRAAASREGLQRTSMRNLAELILRLWGPIRPKHSKAESNENRWEEPFGAGDVSL
ncbi:MAG TPA: hypothetical protein VGL42_02700 [Opitutaceae bacterium]